MKDTALEILRNSDRDNSSLLSILSQIENRKEERVLYLESLHHYNFRHGIEKPKIIGFELYKPENHEPRPCFKVKYESDNFIDYVAYDDLISNHWEIVW